MTGGGFGAKGWSELGRRNCWSWPFGKGAAPAKLQKSVSRTVGKRMVDRFSNPPAKRPAFFCCRRNKIGIAPAKPKKAKATGTLSERELHQRLYGEVLALGADDSPKHELPETKHGVKHAGVAPTFPKSTPEFPNSTPKSLLHAGGPGNHTSPPPLLPGTPALDDVSEDCCGNPSSEDGCVSSRMEEGFPSDGGQALLEAVDGPSLADAAIGVWAGRDSLLSALARERAGMALRRLERSRLELSSP